MLTDKVGAYPEKGKFLVSINSSKSTPFIAKISLANEEESSASFFKLWLWKLSPMAPFFHKDLYHMIFWLHCIFVKKDFLLLSCLMLNLQHSL